MRREVVRAPRALAPRPARTSESERIGGERRPQERVERERERERERESEAEGSGSQKLVV